MDELAREHDELEARFDRDVVPVTLPIDFDVPRVPAENPLKPPTGNAYATDEPSSRRSCTTDLMHLRPLPRKFLPDVPELAYAIGSIGDGSCFAHAVLTSISQSYRDALMSDDLHRLCHVQAGIFRCALMQLTTDDEWRDTLQKEVRATGNSRKIVSMERDVEDELSAQRVRACKLSAWFEEPQIRHMRHKLGINIVVFDAMDGYRQVRDLHAVDGTEASMFDRPFVMVLWEAHQHFCAIGISSALTHDMTDVELRLLFRPDVSADDRRVARAILDRGRDNGIVLGRDRDSVSG
jgi:hypothetical protein